MLVAIPTRLIERIKEFALNLDRKRIQLHLQRVEKDLRRQTPGNIKAAELGKRTKCLNTLRSYAEQGAFPTNTDSARRVPRFVGANGVSCAVAHLMMMDGERELVGDVSRDNNGILIEDLEGGPVCDWLKRNGLSKDEAARIQPTYGSSGPELGFIYWVMMSILAAAFLASEFFGYRIAARAFPKNVFKRRFAQGFLMTAVLSAFLLYGLLYTSYYVFSVKTDWYSTGGFDERPDFPDIPELP